MIENNMEFIDIFEDHICKYTKFKYAVCVDCCTNGILLSFELLSRLQKIDKKKCILEIPFHTYMSVPMTLKNNGWNIKLKKNNWYGSYNIKPARIFDAATDFHENMAENYLEDDIVCVSFQQKKRLALGRGGVILLNNSNYADILRRMRHDGRNSKISDRKELIEFSNNIICGYHCYLEPDKAAKGILLLNQPAQLPPYIQHSWNEYENLKRIEKVLI